MAKLDAKQAEMEKELKELKKSKKENANKIKVLEERIDKHKTQKAVREKLAGVALGTSKLNYLDPRITVAWCAKNNLPLAKVFNKSLITKFQWAINEADENWRF